LEKQRGKLGMTWRLKVQGVFFTVVMLGILALAAGASWIDGMSDWADALLD
jgi:cobalamin synthase